MKIVEKVVDFTIDKSLDLLLSLPSLATQVVAGAVYGKFYKEDGLLTTTAFVVSGFVTRFIKSKYTKMSDNIELQIENDDLYEKIKKITDMLPFFGCRVIEVIGAISTVVFMQRYQVFSHMHHAAPILFASYIASDVVSAVAFSFI